MANLEAEHQEFLIIANATCQRPKQIAEAFKEKFGFEVGKSQISYYDPNNSQASRELAPDLQDLFWSTREAYKKKASEVPIAVQTFRLELLTEMLDHPLVDAFPGAKQRVLEQAAKEMGGLYTQRVTGAKPDDVEAYVAHLMGGVRKAVMQAIPDSQEAERVLKVVSGEVEARMEEEGE